MLKDAVYTFKMYGLNASLEHSVGYTQVMYELFETQKDKCLYIFKHGPPTVLPRVRLFYLFGGKRH